jgi:hypothetical protein
MPLNWKPTIPEDPSPDDLTGNLRHYAFARAVRIQSGPDQGRFRWYLNDLPGATTIKKQGVENSLELAKQTADEQFQSWLAWVGLSPIVAEAEPKPADPSKPTPTPSRPIEPPDQRLPRYLASLCEGLAAYVEEHGPALDSLYKWKIPPVPSFVPFHQVSESLPKANARLKRALSAVWHTQPDRQFEVAEWYVGKWGGVHNREEKLRGYIAATEEDLACSGTAGVASWSKLLAIRDPERFAIFDARVSVALNALQIVQDHARPIFFPSLPSKNTKIGKFYDWMKARDHGEAHKAFPASAYGIYLRVLTEVAQQLRLSSIDEIEMLLFAQAEELALQAMSHPFTREPPAVAAE